MSVSELRNSTAIDKVMGSTAVSDALKSKQKGKGGDQSQSDKPVQGVPLTLELTTESVSMYLQDMSAASCGKIDALIGDLRCLREKLTSDGGLLEQRILEFASLNRSVIKLTDVISDNVAHVQTSSTAG